MNDKYAPFNDPYFKDLSMQDIAELAKNSIRLSKDYCDAVSCVEEIADLVYNSEQAMKDKALLKAVNEIVEKVL